MDKNLYRAAVAVSVLIVLAFAALCRWLATR